MKNQKSVALGTVVGGVVGATATLLTAPKPGEELREDIRNQLSKKTAQTEILASEVREKMSELSTFLNESASNASQTVKDKSDKVINETMEVLNNNQSSSKEQIKILVGDMLKEEMNASEDLKEVVEQEIKEIEAKLNKDINDLKDTLKK